ncbi:MAG: hypothetical protein SNH28_02640 [Rikenellaceae bacterium]
MTTERQHTLSCVVIFVITALISSTLLISSFILWLGDIIGSHLLAMVLVGVVCGVTAFTIYRISLHAMVSRLKEQIDTIYDVASTAQLLFRSGIKSILGWLSKL